jgi:hypothetical protein
MPRGQRRAVVFLFLLSLAMSVAAYLAATNYYRDGQATQQRQGLVLERKLCGSFGKLAGLHPPPGNPATNPSRAYLQTQHDILAGIGADLQCPGGSP